MAFDEEPDGDPHGECAAEIHRLGGELEAISATLGGTAYMDQPDGGAPTLAERVHRMGLDAARYRLLRRALTDPRVSEAIAAASVCEPRQREAWRSGELLDRWLDGVIRRGL